MQLSEGQARVDAPLLLRQVDAAKRQDTGDLRRWDAWILSCRDTTELRAAEMAMGAALLRLAPALNIALPWQTPSGTTFITSFAMLAAHWRITPELGVPWLPLELVGKPGQRGNPIDGAGADRSPAVVERPDATVAGNRR